MTQTEGERNLNAAWNAATFRHKAEEQKREKNDFQPLKLIHYSQWIVFSTRMTADPDCNNSQQQVPDLILITQIRQRKKTGMRMPFQWQGYEVSQEGMPQLRFRRTTCRKENVTPSKGLIVTATTAMGEKKHIILYHLRNLIHNEPEKDDNCLTRTWSWLIC